MQGLQPFPPLTMYNPVELIISVVHLVQTRMMYPCQRTLCDEVYIWKLLVEGSSRFNDRLSLTYSHCGPNLIQVIIRIQTKTKSVPCYAGAVHEALRCSAAGLEKRHRKWKGAAASV
jgi:hypothetical protein